MQFLVARLFERLRTETPAYDWDDTIAPFHSVCYRAASLSSSKVRLLTPEYSPTTTTTSMDTVVLHNPSIANRANPQVELVAETAERTAKQTKTKTKRVNEAYPMRNKAMMSSLASLATQHVSSASLVLRKDSRQRMTRNAAIS